MRTSTKSILTFFFLGLIFLFVAAFCAGNISYNMYSPYLYFVGFCIMLVGVYLAHKAERAYEKRIKELTVNVKRR